MPDPDRPDEAPAPAPAPAGDFPSPPPPGLPQDEAAERRRCLQVVGEVLLDPPGPSSLHDAFERIRAGIEGADRTK